MFQAPRAVAPREYVDAKHLAWMESAADYTWAIVVRER
jgi:hypothetical protein